MSHTRSHSRSHSRRPRSDSVSTTNSQAFESGDDGDYQEEDEYLAEPASEEIFSARFSLCLQLIHHSIIGDILLEIKTYLKGTHQ